MSFLQKIDPQIAKIIKNELGRQRNGLEMIASENLASPAVMEAMGSVLANKYAEGYPGKRYYAGNQFIDQVETLAIERAQKLFGAEHANVQPHSGSQANAAAYFALLEPGDKILAMDLAHGGHLTHGAPFNFSGKFYRASFYGVDEKTGRIDLAEVRRLAKKIRPKLILTGASAYPREIDFSAFRRIADEIGAYLMADIAHIAGLVAAKLHPDPVPHCDVVTTTTHKTLRGPRGAIILCKNENRLRTPPNLPLARGGERQNVSPSYQGGSGGGRRKNLAQLIDAAVFPGLQGGPLEHLIAAKAVAFREALRPSFKTYQRQVLKNAQTLAQTLLDEGLELVSGGTDNHLLLVDLAKTGLGGKEAETQLESIGIYANKNMIPYDKRPSADPSGLRLGTPALTTRGLREKEMKMIGKIIADVIKNPRSLKIKKTAGKAVAELVKNHPLYPELK